MQRFYYIASTQPPSTDIVLGFDDIGMSASPW